MNVAAITQPELALEKANEVRVRRAMLKAWLMEADRPESQSRAALILETTPWFAETMAAVDLLRSVRRSGSRVAAAWLRRVGVFDTRTLGELTDRQRTALCELLRDA